MTENTYANMPLTSGIARDLIPKLFAGKGYTKRSVIVDTFTHYLNENGGMPTPKTQRISAVKKALQDLEAERVVARHPNSPGYWRVLD